MSTIARIMSRAVPRLWRRTFPVIAATGALAAALSGVLAGSMPAQASTWQAWVPRPSAASCPKGDWLVSPTSASTDALGVVHFRYASFPTLTSALPPRDFNAKQESAGLRADLAESGVPAAGAQRLAQSRTAPEFCASTHLYAAPQSPQRATRRTDAAGSAASGIADHWTENWAGYSVNGGTGFNGVEATWTVKQSIPDAYQPSEDATWVGIGGDHADIAANSNWSLIQAGTDMMSGNGYRMWFEWVCGSCGNTINVTYGPTSGISFTGTNKLSVGDSISANVTWSNTSTACFNVVDSKGPALGGCVSSPVPYDNKSIEWIDEDAYSGAGTIWLTLARPTGRARSLLALPQVIRFPSRRLPPAQTSRSSETLRPLKLTRT